MHAIAEGDLAIDQSGVIAGRAPDVARRAPDDEAAVVLSDAIKAESSTPLPYLERMTASGPEKVFLIDAEYVKQMVASVVKDQDLSRYIL